MKKICGTANLSPLQAFDSSISCARIGIHNDCFMASSQDQGTFDSNAQRTWLTNEGRYVVVGGESCEANSLTGCSGGVDQISKQRFTYLNVEYHETVINLRGKFFSVKNIPVAIIFQFPIFKGNPRMGKVWHVTSRSLT